jgi:hypothetical protein
MASAGEPAVLWIRKVRREDMRWRCLQFLDAARPDGMTDSALLPLIRMIYPDATLKELRRELDYLGKADLFSIEPLAADLWQLHLTYHGIDLVEYTNDCPPGIGRPHFQE